MKKLFSIVPVVLILALIVIPVLAETIFTHVPLSLPTAWDSVELYGIWGSSASDVHIVGDGEAAGIKKPVIYHYDGSSWTNVSPALPSGWEFDGLRGTWGSSASNVYAVGKGMDAGTVKPLIYQYNGSNWTNVSPALPTGWTEGTLGTIWGSSASDVYAAGFGKNAGVTKPLIFHYDGSTWTEASPAALPAWNYSSIIGIWGSSASDVHAVGLGNNDSTFDTPTVYHYNGTSWTVSALAKPSGLSNGELVSVWGSGSADVYAAGMGMTADYFDKLALYHYDGSSWMEITADLPGSDGGLRGVWGSEANDVYVAGYDGDGSPLIYNYDGNSWTDVSPARPSGWGSSRLADIWGSIAGDVYAAGTGNNGVDEGNNPLLYHYVAPPCTASITVSNANDSGAGSLRQAIADVCKNGTITFNGDYTINLTGRIDIDRNMTLDGTGHHVVLNGPGSSCDGDCYFLIAVEKGTLTMKNLSMTNAYAGASEEGGGIINYANLVIQGSSFYGNIGSYSGVLYNFGTAAITNSTFVGNTGRGWGGAMMNNGLVNGNAAAITITNSTIAANTADVGSNIANWNSTSGVTLLNSIVANGSGGANCDGTIYDGGYNLDSGTSCGFSADNGSINSTDPQLGPFSNTAGDTNTLPLAPDSPAVDTGDDAVCAAAPVNGKDQRGLARPKGAHCDIGAYELTSSPTGLALSASSVNENRPVGTTVGTFSATDPDAIDTFTYSLTCATPGVNDASFSITGNALKTAAIFDYEKKNSYGICVRVTDSGGMTFDKNFTITVNNLTETGTSTFYSIGTQDGWILESGENTVKGGMLNTTATTLNLGDDAANKQYRAILSFNTALPQGAVITKVTLKFKYSGVTGTLPFSTHGNLLVDMRRSGFSNNNALQLGDFAVLPGTLGKSAAFSYVASNKAANGWYAKLLPATIFTYINKTGITQFRLRFARDDNNDKGADFLKIFSGNSVYKPQLVIEYRLS